MAYVVTPTFIAVYLPAVGTPITVIELQRPQNPETSNPPIDGYETTIMKRTRKKNPQSTK
jgi:hypothetical protein